MFMRVKDAFVSLCRSQRSILFIFASAMLMPNIFLIASEPFTITTIIANLVIPFAIYLLWALVAPKPGVMMLIGLPLMILGAFQLVVWSLFQGSVVAIDMVTNIMTTNVSEATELLSNMTPAIIGVCVLYIPLILLAICSLKLSKGLTLPFRLRMASFAALLLVVGAVSSSASARRSPDYALKYHLFPLNILYNIEQSVVRWQRSNGFEHSSKGFDYAIERQDSTTSRKIYVYVIGEASRASNWSMFGYDRATTPLLEGRDGLVPFGNVTTESNTTHKSVPMLLSSVSAIDYTDIFRRKGIVTLFKQAGFKTIFVSNQVANRSLIDYFGDEADQRFDITPKDGQLFSANTYDGNALPIISQVMDADSSDLFIVLHTRGSHFNFRDRYPASQAKFVGDHYTSVNAAQREMVLNAYDNSILYTDRVLSELIDMLSVQRATTALYYISDHGEDVMDDDRGRFLHASPTLTYHQLHVASFVWLSPQYRQSFPHRYAAAQHNSGAALSSASAFHTVAQMAGIESPYVKERWSPLSADLERYSRLYLNDYESAVDIYHIGLQEQDYKLFDRHGLHYDPQMVIEVKY